MRISCQPTPNIHAMKFTLDRRVTEGRSKTYTSVEQAKDDPLARTLLEIPGVRMVFFLNDFITVTRDPSADWEAIVPEVERRLRAHFGEE